MIGSSSIVAKKYAQAFLNVFIDQLTEKSMQQVYKLNDFLAKNHLLISFLRWPVITQEIKLKEIEDLFAQFKLDKSFNRLLIALSNIKRLYLIDDILKYICMLYAKRKNIIHFTVTSSHDLTKQERTVIREFLANITDASIIDEYKVDKNLIAGIRLQSDTQLWQYSIGQHLDMMKLPLIR